MGLEQVKKTATVELWTDSVANRFPADDAFGHRPPRHHSAAEQVLIGTVAVLAMVVGLSEVSFNINNELHDFASAFGAMNQSFRANGASDNDGRNSGSSFGDQHDFCDGGSLTSVSPNGGEQ